MKKYKAIIYDIDGTLLDTLKMNMYPLMKIIKEETGEDWTFEQVLKFAAYPGMKVMEELGVKDQEKTYARWVQYVNDYEDGATLFEGFEEVLETFKNKKIKQAIVSSKLREQYEIDIVSKGIDQYMEAVILQDDTTFQQTYNALGCGKNAFFFAFFRKIILLIPLIYLLPFILPSYGVYAVVLAEPISDLMTTILNGIYFKHFVKKTLA